MEEKKTRRVVLFGATSGKSTLANALLGWDVLPQGANYCSNATRAEVEVKYGPEKRAVAHVMGQAREIGWSQLTEFICTPLRCKKVEVFYPSELLRQGIVLVDTPSLDLDFPDQPPRGDVYLWVWNADLFEPSFFRSFNQEYVEKELRLHRAWFREGEDLYFVVNYSREEQQLEWAAVGSSYLMRRTGGLSRHGDGACLQVDAMSGLVAAIESDSRAGELSGVGKLYRRLLPRDERVIPLFPGASD